MRETPQSNTAAPGPTRGAALLCAWIALAGGWWAGPDAVLAAEPDAGAPEHALARRILNATGVKGGLVVHVGCGDGKLTAALRANDSYVVHGLDTDARNVRQARRHIESLGLCGKVSVERLSGGGDGDGTKARLPYAENLLNLLVSEDLGRVAMSEVLRVLAPGGAAYVKAAGEWTKTLKPRPREIDEWPHFLHGADGNPVARDLVAGPPRHVQWLCGPAWSKHHEKFPPTIPIIVSAGGRVFYLEDETPPSFFNVASKWSLKARDAFNGALLWRRAVPNWPPEVWPGKLGGWAYGPADYRRRLVAAGDRLYVTLGQQAPVTALDAATGKTVRTYCEGHGFTEIVHDQGVLYVAFGQTLRSAVRLAAFRAETGKKLWESPAGHGIAVHGGRVFFIADRNRSLGALDAATGREVWRASPLEDVPGKYAGRNRKLSLQGPLRAGCGAVLVCPGDRGSVAALSAETGKLLWARKHGAPSWYIPVSAHIIGGLVWMTAAGENRSDVAKRFLSVGLDPQSGQVRRSVPCGQIWNAGHHGRCFPSKATDRYMIHKRRGTDFLDLASGEVSLNNWARGACSYGLMPCNGLLYFPPHSCRCYSETALRGLHALAPRRAERLAPLGPSAGVRLERGEAYGQLANAKPAAGAPDDWPTYRHDGLRSGSTGTAVPADLAPTWSVRLGGRLSSPTVAGGKVFVAATDAHCVRALSAETGEAAWSFTAGGRVDTPPTIHAGRALFGCADGWVYCLRADDGRLAWRFRAAPAERRVGVDGQLESAWPVRGSVLVHEGVAYFAAGRSSFLDGGIYLYGLDAATGRKLHEHHLVGPFTDAGMTKENPNRGFVMPGALPDVLVTDGARVYMRHLAFDPALKAATDMLPNFYKAPKRSGENFGGDHKYWCDLLEAPRLALRSDPNWYFRSYFYNFPGARLYSTTGLLDESWHIRSYWSYGQVVGQYLVFRGRRGYAVKAYPNAARWLAFRAGDGYVLYAGETAVPQPGRRLYALRPEEHRWRAKLPLRPKAMALAGGTLFVVGPPDPAEPDEALAALEGKQGALLWAISAADGKKLAERKLDAPPVFDGLAAAGGRLFLSTKAGEVVCLKGR